MTIAIRVIPHSAQRYPTAGDWVVRGDNLLVLVSDTGNSQYNQAIGLHELVEAMLCIQRGISQEAVDAFDIAFEAARAEGNDAEPGDDPTAPYFNEHMIATVIERIFLSELGLAWPEYERAIAALSLATT